MVKEEAYKIINRYFRKDNPNENDEFIFIESCNFLIETENDPNIMCDLGGYYYDKQKYALAEKYYLMAFEGGNDYSADGLGYIYYYGRNGERDYKKAFYYYSIAKEKGNMEAAMKIADMYHNGYGVEKDDQKYKEILIEIFDKIKDTKDLFEPLPEVFSRISDILINEGQTEEALSLLDKAKSFIVQRIRFNPFWGNFIVCRRIIQLIYKIYPFDKDKFDFFDLFYLLKESHTINLIYNGNNYVIESFYDEGEMRIKCNNKFYKSVENFLMNALFDNKHTYVIDYEDYYNLEVIE